MFVIAFFRNPKRSPEGGPQAMAPADGVIADIEEVTDPSVLLNCLRIRYFSVRFDVHVNKFP